MQPFSAIENAKLRHYLMNLGVLRSPERRMILQDVVSATPADGWIGPTTLKAMKPLARHVFVMEGYV